MINIIVCYVNLKTEIGNVYKNGDDFFDARKQMIKHIEKEHISVFDYLINLDKKITGFSNHQSKILDLFYKGESDYNIKEKLNIGSVSTVRNHRYMLKEKEKQAKAIVTIMSILSKNINQNKELIKPHKTAKMIDDRYNTTNDESKKIINNYFPDGTNGKLRTFYTKEKNKIIILREIIKKFEFERKYTEKEVNEILKNIYLEDYTLIRRYLIEYGFMDREKDGSFYWVKEIVDKNLNKKEKEIKKVNDRKKKLREEYKAKIASEDIINGVYQIKNLVNGKIFLGTSRNIRQLNGIIFQLNMGTFMNKGLQNDWNEFGKENFVIEILEEFKEKENSTLVHKKMKELEKKWKENLMPYGDKGYHKIVKK